MSVSKNNIRILDKSTYPRKTLETFEMVAAYYVDLFYNHLYFEARKLRNDKVVSSITEGYKHALTSFLQGIENPKLYKKSLMAMHTFFIENGFASLTFTQCTERVTKEFIPEDYYDSVLNTKKNSILRNVLNGVNKNFILKLVNDYLGMIIDQHAEVDNTRLLQDEFIDLLLIEKESMYKRFVIGKVGAIGGNFSKKHEIFESMQREIKMLCTEKYESRKLVNKLKKIIIAKEEYIQQNLEKIEQLTNIINEMKSEIGERTSMPHIVPSKESDKSISTPILVTNLSSGEDILEEDILINSDNDETQIGIKETTINRSDNLLESNEKINNPDVVTDSQSEENRKSVFITFDDNADIWS